MESLWDFSRSESSRRSEDTSVLPESHPGLLFHTLLQHFFPALKQDGALIKVGTRINHDGVIKRANVDLWDTEINSPDNSPSLWTDIDYCDGVRVIPAVISATAAFALDELGWWQGKVYKSLMHGNCWTPTQEPGQWEEVVT